MIGFSHACDPRASKVGRERFGLTKRNGHTPERKGRGELPESRAPGAGVWALLERPRRRDYLLSAQVRPQAMSTTMGTSRGMACSILSRIIAASLST